jgi:hypothetical protein
VKLEARFGLVIAYRIAYGRACDVIHRAGPYADPLEVPIDPTEAAGRTLDDPELHQAVLEAIDDARHRRRPRW